MTPSSSIATAMGTEDSTTNAEPAQGHAVTAHQSDAQGAPGALTELGPESAKLHTVRGLNGWTLYCIEDGDSSEGFAVLERFTDKGPADMLIADWHHGGDEATVLTVTLRGGGSFSLHYVDDIHVSLADAALKQLGRWGVDAFVLE